MTKPLPRRNNTLLIVQLDHNRLVIEVYCYPTSVFKQNEPYAIGSTERPMPQRPKKRCANRVQFLLRQFQQGLWLAVYR